MDNALSNIDLTTPQYAVLAQLSEFPGLSNADLARKSFVTPQTMNLIVQNLEARGYIERNSAEGNARIMNAKITKFGMAELKKANVLVLEIEKSIFSVLTNQEEIDLATILKKLV